MIFLPEGEFAWYLLPSPMKRKKEISDLANKNPHLCKAQGHRKVKPRLKSEIECQGWRNLTFEKEIQLNL